MVEGAGVPADDTSLSLVVPDEPGHLISPHSHLDEFSKAGVLIPRARGPLPGKNCESF